MLTKCEQPQHLAILSALNLSSERGLGLSEKLLPHVATNEDNDLDDGGDAWTRAPTCSDSYLVELLQIRISPICLLFQADPQHPPLGHLRCGARQLRPRLRHVHREVDDRRHLRLSHPPHHELQRQLLHLLRHEPHLPGDILQVSGSLVIK